MTAFVTADDEQVKADGGLKEFLVNWGYKRKLYHLEQGRANKDVSRPS